LTDYRFLISFSKKIPGSAFKLITLFRGEWKTMIVKPKIRNNICLTSHPQGCAQQVREQIEYVRGRESIHGPKRALIIGASNGYGLAARIVSAFGAGADTIGLSYEKPGSQKRPGTAGWYNNAAFEREAQNAGLGAWSVNGDAFNPEIKGDILSLARDVGPLDLVVYSIAAPRRIDAETGQIYSSALKPIGKPITAKMVDIVSGSITEVTSEAATEEEVEHTVKVMGGEDWLEWIEALDAAGLLAQRALTIAFSYIGPPVTAPFYRDGTIGRAKQDLENTAGIINERFGGRGVRAIISVNKALVTRASAVIPAVPLYISLLYRVMKQKGLHEGCIQQMYRLFHDFLYTDNPRHTDSEGRIRLDDWEMREDVQEEVMGLWSEVDSGNLSSLADIAGFREEFLAHHGFGMGGVDYEKDVEV
jgi:enoyl-[acyl-carrier protein] reductase/trans-2-enoyl-CoA reductase (NAD+)